MEATLVDNALDTFIWQDLPFDVVEKVLQKLPLPALMRFCLVSKRWKALIESTEFAMHCEASKPVVFFSCNFNAEGASLTLLNASTNLWEEHLLPSEINTFKDLEVVAGAHGLLCFTDRIADMGRVLVFNPLTKRSRLLELPEWFKSEVLSREMLVGMVMNQETGNYKLVFTGVCSTQTLIYDSGSTSWTTTVARIPKLESGYAVDDANLVKWRVGKGLCCDGNLYWLLEEVYFGFPSSHFKTLVKYDVKLDRWSVGHHPESSNMILRHFLSTQDGNLLIWTWTSSIPDEFRALGPEIKPLRQLGGKVYSDTRRGSYGLPYIVIAHGDHFYVRCKFCCPLHPTVYFKVLVFDRSLKEVSRSPDVPYFELRPNFMDVFVATLKAFV